MVLQHGAIGLAVVNSVGGDFASGYRDPKPEGLDDFPIVDLIVVNNNQGFLKVLGSMDWEVTGTVTPGKNIPRKGLSGETKFKNSVEQGNKILRILFPCSTEFLNFVSLFHRIF